MFHVLRLEYPPDVFPMYNTVLLQNLFNSFWFLSLDVSFNAQMTGHVPLNSGDKLLFDNVISNAGNGYNAATGIFTAPHNGTYEFTLITMTNSGHHYAWITVNGVRLSVTHGPDGYRSGKRFQQLPLVEEYPTLTAS